MARTRGAGGRLRLRLAAVALAVSALVAPAIAPAQSAAALSSGAAAASVDYPTWNDVKKARASEAATARKIAEIEALLKKLEADLVAAQELERVKGEEYEAAQDAYDTQVAVTADLVAQADAAQLAADEAKTRARQFLSHLSRTGSSDLVTNLLTADEADADSLLYRLETMSQLSERSDQIYAQATQLQNTARSLGDQAEVAEQKLEELRVIAEQALVEAQDAAQAAQDAVIAQEEHQVELQAQLTVLKEKRVATEADYQKGVKARAEAERKRLAALAAQAAAAGTVNSAGWGRPSAGYISSPYGMRYHPIYHSWRLHNGTDIAGQGCGAPVRAVHSGVVTYAGWNGTLGNYVQIDHGDGTSSGYGHIVNGGILVHRGQSVAAGSQIARVGSTGASTGCHVHFIIRVGGQLTDPVPFMRNRGVSLGG